MPIYVGVNGEAKLVTEAYIGNRNNQAVPLYLGNIIPKTHIPVSHIYLKDFIGNASTKYIIDTNVEPTAYTKTITVFIPHRRSSSVTTSLIYSAGDYFSLGFFNNNPSGIYVYCGDFKITTINTYNGIGPELSTLEDLNSIPTTYYTVIMNKSSRKDTVLKINNNSEYITLGTNSSGTIRNPTTIKLLFMDETPIRYFAVYRNSLTNITPIKEYFPCIERSSGRVGLYETVEGIFYSNYSDKIAAGPVIDKYDLPSFD